MIIEIQVTADSRPTGRVHLLTEAAVANFMRGPGGLFTPVLGPLMQRRRTIALLATAVFAMVGLTAAGITTWQCPLRSTLGIICPGCGLTRAIVLLVQGHWQPAIALHAFAPVVLAIGILLAASSVMPERLRKVMVVQVTDFERRTGITALLILSALIYWVLRIRHLI